MSKPKRFTLARTLLTVALGVGLAGLAACGNVAGGGAAGGTPQRGGILTMSLSGTSPSDNLDPALSESISTSVLCSAIYSNLIDSDNRWKLTPALALSWDNVAAKTWTFHLRPGVKFQDGSPLTAKDVAYSIGRLLSAQLGSSLYGELSGVLDTSGIKVVNDETIEFDLKKADSGFPTLMAQRNAAIVKDGTTKFTVASAIGTGPFEATAFNASTGWTLKRNPNYWKPGLPYLDGVQATIVPQMSTKVQTVVAGTADIADYVDFTTATNLKSNPAVQLYDLPNAIEINLVMDHTQKPFNDPRVVQAIKLATDRAQIQKFAYQGFASIAADTAAPTDDPFYPSNLKTPGYDIGKAKQLLAEAGYPNGIDLTLYSTDNIGGQEDMVAAFAQSVKPAGIRVKIQNTPVSAYDSSVWLQKSFYVSYWGRRQPAEMLSVQFAGGAPWNETKMRNAQMDADLAKYYGSTNPAVQKAALQDALTVLSTQGSVLIPGWTDSIWPAKPNVKGFQLSYDRAAVLEKAYLSK